jgi:hypothetical protein
MVVAGAAVGYQLRDRGGLRARAVVAWAGLGAALAWHLPFLLSWAESQRTAHALAHVTLVVAGAAMGWAAPRLGGGAKAALFIGGTVVMWPLMLGELAGGLDYPEYPGQAAAAGVAGLLAMPVVWFLWAFWGPLDRLLSRPAAPAAVAAALAAVTVLGWIAPA